MGEIGFTQYLKPNGERRDRWVQRPDEVCWKAGRLLEQGMALEAEVLTTGLVSLTVVHPEGDEDVAIQVVPNDERLPGAVDRLVESACKWLDAYEAGGVEWNLES